jgi:hypothetical protein
MYITAKLLDFVHRPDFHKPENTTFRKLDLFSSSGEGGHLLYRKTKSLPFLRRCQDKQSRCPPPLRLRKETDPVSETLGFLVCGNPDDGQSPEA